MSSTPVVIRKVKYENQEQMFNQVIQQLIVIHNSFNEKVKYLEAKIDSFVLNIKELIAPENLFHEKKSHCCDEVLVKLQDVERLVRNISLNCKSQEELLEEAPVVLVPQPTPSQKDTNSTIQVITLNCEADYPAGSWLGNEKNPEARVRVPITPSKSRSAFANMTEAERLEHRRRTNNERQRRYFARMTEEQKEEKKRRGRERQRIKREKKFVEKFNRMTEEEKERYLNIVKRKRTEREIETKRKYNRYYYLLKRAEKNGTEKPELEKTTVVKDENVGADEEREANLTEVLPIEQIILRTPVTDLVQDQTPTQNSLSQNPPFTIQIENIQAVEEVK